MADRTELRYLGDVTFRHPAKVPVNLGPLQLQLAGINTEEQLRALRTNKLKSEREKWHGAFLTYAWSKIWEKELLYAYRESQDYDIIVRSDTVRAVIKVKLKELPPKMLNQGIALQDLVDEYRSNKKYDLKGTTVAIFVDNENSRLEKKDIPPPVDPEIWLFGFAAPNHTIIFAAGHSYGQMAFWVMDPPLFARNGYA